MEVLFKILIECLKYLLTPYYTFVCMKYYQSRTESIWKRYFLFFQPNIFIRKSTFGFVYVFEGYNVSRVFFFNIETWRRDKNLIRNITKLSPLTGQREITLLIKFYFQAIKMTYGQRVLSKTKQNCILSQCNKYQIMLLNP